MKILFVQERWADGNQALGESDGCHWRRSWERLCRKDESQIFFYDSPPQHLKGSLDEKLVSAWSYSFAGDGAGLVMFTHLISWSDRNVKKETWQKLRDVGAKVVAVWHESSPDVVRAADEHADCVDLNLFIDTKEQFLKFSKRPEKCFGLYDPRDPEVFKPLEKDIGILFNGTLLNRVERLNYVFSLLANNVPVTHVGGRRELFIGQDQMVEMLGRAKICLNFADGGPGKHYKGRVAEALLSGCLLMEQDNPETPNILTAFKEYIPFSNPQDLVQKAAYYLGAGDAEREKIARQGREAALEKLDGREFWKQLFIRLK